jgi:hypothetical protein
MTVDDELREVVMLKQELEITRRNMKELEERLSEKAEEARLAEKFGS